MEMKRDLKLILKILRYLEQSSKSRVFGIPDFNGYERLYIEYHMKLAEEAGYINSHYHGGETSYQLTWAGHEHLDRNRD